MRVLVLASLLVALAGCMTLRVQMEHVPLPDERRWQQEITQRVNEHAKRLDALDGGKDEDADQTAR